MLHETPLVRNLFACDTLDEVKPGQMESLLAEYPYFAHARWFLAAKTPSQGAGKNVRHLAAVYCYDTLKLDWALDLWSGMKDADASIPISDPNSMEGSQSQEAHLTPEPAWVPEPESASEQAPPVTELEFLPVEAAAESEPSLSGAGNPEAEPLGDSLSDSDRPEDPSLEAESGSEAAMIPVSGDENALRSEDSATGSLDQDALVQVEAAERSAENPEPQVPVLEHEDLVEGSHLETHLPFKGEVRTASTPQEANAAAARPTQEEPPPTVFQPLFTQDYFAFTGTRVPSELPNDKPPTMAQVRSFTDWLRSMKRPSGSSDPDQMEDESLDREVPDPQQNRVVHIAQQSNFMDHDVLTEAMAEVRLSQGQQDKALDIYRKLSLLYPEKKSYFAHKIEQILNSC